MLGPGPAGLKGPKTLRLHPGAGAGTIGVFRLYAGPGTDPRIARTRGCAMAEPATSTDTMSGSDALLWTISGDPVMRPTIVALVMLDRTPDWAEVRARVGSLTEAVPRLRSRAVTRAPGRGRPQFVVDDTFSLDTHLRRIRLPEHGVRRDLLDMAQVMATSGFDPALPLWEAVLVEGVDGDRAALVMKVHHALIDGVGGLAVLAHLFDSPGTERPRSRVHTAPPTASRSPVPHPADLPDAVRLVDERGGRGDPPLPLARPARRGGHLGGPAHGPVRQARLADHDRAQLPAPRRDHRPRARRPQARGHGVGRHRQRRLRGVRRAWPDALPRTARRRGRRLPGPDARERARAGRPGRAGTTSYRHAS